MSCQNKCMAIDFSQQIIPGRFAYALSHIVDNHLDFTRFDDCYNNAQGVTAAYPTPFFLTPYFLAAIFFHALFLDLTMLKAV